MKHHTIKNQYRLPTVGLDIPLHTLYYKNSDGMCQIEDLPHMRCLNPDDPMEKRLPLAAAIGIASLFLRSPRHEQGLIIRKNFGLESFENGAPESAQPCLVKMEDDKDFNRLAQLAAEGQVWGWAHSHPNFDPMPSGIDIRYHQFNFNMVIFSCVFLTFSVHTAKEIEAMVNNRATYDLGINQECP